MLKAVFVGRYLVTTFKVVPRGTEGAVSVEGTIAGLLASVLLAFVGSLTGQVLPTHPVQLSGFHFVLFFVWNCLDLCNWVA